jgi:hypothetical protein
MGSCSIVLALVVLIGGLLAVLFWRRRLAHDARGTR